MTKEEALSMFKKELEKNGFKIINTKEMEDAIKVALRNDYANNSMAMTVYGLLDGKFSSIKDECEKIFLG